jgi:hypothetical protein
MIGTRHGLRVVRGDYAGFLKSSTRRLRKVSFGAAPTKAVSNLRRTHRDYHAGRPSRFVDLARFMSRESIDVHRKR